MQFLPTRDMLHSYVMKPVELTCITKSECPLPVRRCPPGPTDVNMSLIVFAVQLPALSLLPKAL